MDIRHLHAFVIIAEEMHLTRAAQRLQIAQPHVTRMLQHLEEELGFSLFDRSNKRQMTLTPAGQIFLTRITPMLEQYEETVQAALRVARGEADKLVVGCVTAAMLSGILPRAIQEFDEVSQRELVLRDLSFQSYDGQIKVLSEHHLDALLIIRPFDETGIEHECVSKVPLMLALPSTHRLVSLEAIPLAMLADEAFVQASRQIYPRFTDEGTHLCQQAGFNPKVVRKASHLQAVLSLVASGIGIAFVTGWTPLAIQQQDVVYRLLLDVNYQVELHLLWRKDDCSPLVQTFLQVVREVSAKLDHPSAQKETSE